MKTAIQRAISDVLYFNGLFELFQTALDFHLRLKNEPWLARVLERHGDEVSVTHYVEQNADLLRDPETAFSLQTVTTAMPLFEGWVPLTTEPGGFGRVYPTIKHDANGKLAGYYPRAMKDAYAFAALWARNLRSRGFVRRYPAGEIESLTDLRELAERLALAEAPIPVAHETIDCVGGIKTHRYLFPADGLGSCESRPTSRPKRRCCVIFLLRPLRATPTVWSARVGTSSTPGCRNAPVTGAQEKPLINV